MFRQNADVGKLAYSAVYKRLPIY